MPREPRPDAPPEGRSLSVDRPLRAPEPAGTVRLLAGGDVMLGEHPLMVGWGLGTRLRRAGGAYPFTHLRDLLAGADLTIANLECSLADAPPGAPYDSRQCVGPASGAAALAAAGWRAVSVANNHVLQHGPAIFRDTMERLRRAGVEPVGEAAEGGGEAGEEPHRRCRPLDLDLRGVPLRLLAYSLRPRQHFTAPPLYAEPTAASLRADVRDGSAAGRTVIVSLHWGDEFVSRPSPAQIALGRRLLDEGATLVLGHHPHVLQGWERRGPGLIAYSLGNLAFDMLWEERLRHSALLDVRLAPGRVVEAAWRPLALGRDFQPRPAKPQQAAAIEAFLADAAEKLAAWPDNAGAEAVVAAFAAGPSGCGEPAPVRRVPPRQEAVLPGPTSLQAGHLAEQAYRREVARALRAHRRASQAFFARHLWRYEPRVLAAILDKAFLRRVGRLKD